jgi:hypothetical protein
MEDIKLEDTKTVVNFELEYFDTSSKDIFSNRIEAKRK